ncbi:glycosyltransferase family 2 protein [Oceanobacillus jeddahense]|uniref:Glycosyltransferase n=1 Tax=Oceanobacillus jeddahense TaxID=1462527 RepID=A0ABY5JS08_9BACI|nr:glycosyltransferase family 2 protein [Oceanobacillus jeddahense]UUI02569.1 glycosyltransferase [Oceanobacillus jeddahense]
MGEKKPIISVITPTYNSERFIAETIESVQAQSFSEWEMIIVDDCSTDQTAEIVKSYAEKDDRIHLTVLDENQGSAITRNTAMDKSQGRYLAFLDSDDLWLPEKLEKQLVFMQDNGVAFSFTQYVRMNEDGTDTGAVSTAPATVTYEDLMKRCVIGCLTVMLDRERIGERRMVNIRTRQDYAFWLEITRSGHFAYGLPEVLARYRLVGNSISSNKWKAAKRNWYVFREVEKQPLPQTIYYFSHYVARSLRDLLKWNAKK